ncbi:autotransporter domain-containing protein [Rhizobium lusitanum]|uniref:Outer membrane autotransporter protein n=1 Tax=Rhizobium lusitanum TaxID=293958 RepID=A0A7X0MF90_9HYPH|nr:autotransporter domain-containing protein [Rhizobium lusitanum]MBB6488514.1 outer membrane autotransporter protein [Rhizobium lusitanum]
MCSKKTREPFPRFLLPTGVCVALTGAGIIPAHATCSTAGLTVTCSGVANPLAPSYANSANNINATVNPGASVGVLLGVGGTAMSLTGNNNTLTNNGTIDPSALGSGLGVLSSGAVVGNASASPNTTVINNGTMYGSTGVAVSGVTGMALSVQNGTGGTSNIRNTGTIGSNPLVGATLSGADAPVVAAYGGGTVNMTNSGTIYGRVSFGSNGTPGQGNTFTNSGTINGGVSMGANGNNTFTAVTGSSVNTAGGTGGAFNITVGPNTLNVAATGIVDGGAGGNNMLKLQQGVSANGTIAVNNYINFNHLNVQAGNWTINGASTAQDATLSGGVAIINDNASLGTGTITATGGALQAGTAGLDVSNNVALGAGGLTVQGATGLTLSGTVSGGGALTKNDGGTLTLSGASTYTGGTNLNGGGLIVSNSAALGTGALNVNAAASLDASTNVTLGNGINLATGTTLTIGGSNNLGLSGTIAGAGGLVKNGAATTMLTGANTYTGETTINAGTLALGAGGSIAATGTLNLTGAGATFDLSGASGAQTIGSLAGAAGTNVDLGSNSLTIDGTINATYAGTIGGAGSVTVSGAGTQSLTGTNVYTGGTNLNGGNLVVGSNTALGSGAVNVNGSSTLDATTNVSLANGINVATGTTLTLGGSTALGLSGTISGGGGLIKNGAATTTLNGANTYTGGTTINAGTLALGAGGSLASMGAVNLASSGATFDLSSATGAQSIGALNGVAGTNVNLGANALTLGGTAGGTFSGAIGGAGSLTLAGSGAQTLAGASTYTGGTHLNSGSLVLGNSAALGTGALNVNVSALLDTSANVTLSNTVNLAAGSTLTLGGSNALTLSGGIAGAAALVKNGAATTTLNGANTYTGGTTINAGTLALGAGGSLASMGAVSLASAGATFDLSGASGAQTIGALSGVVGTNVNLGGNALTLAGSGNTTYSGAIGGVGSLTMAGSGTQTLTGASTYAGGTTINAGTLSVSSDANLGAASGALTFTGGVLATTGSFISGRSVTLNGTGAFDVAAGDTLGLTGTLSGAGSFTKAGSGIFDYDGNGSGFTGMTEVAAGSLIVGSDASHANATLGGSVTANNGATLGGHGTVGSGSGSVVTIGSGGTVAPGNSIGTLTVNGNYVQAAGSTYVAEIDPSGASDLIKVTGTATINGGTVSVLKAPGSYAPGTHYTLLTAAGGVTGTYGTLGQNMPFVDLALNYDANDVFLDVARNNVAFPAVGITRNQKATAGALESLGSGSTLYTVIAGAPDAGTARADFDALSGEIHASARSALIDDSYFVRDAANNRIRSAFGDATGADMPLLGYGPDGVKPVTADSIGAVAWGQAFGTWGSYDGDGNAAGMDTSIGGFLAGLDGEVAENVRLGLLAGYSRTSFDVSDRASSGSSDNWHLGLYGGGKWNALRLSGGLAYTWHDIATSRSVAFPGVTDSLSSDYHAGTVQAFGEAGYRIDTAGGFAFEPFANLAYVSLHTNGFSEDGGNAALRGNGGTTDTTFTTLGLHLSSVFDLGGTKTNAHGTLGWRHAFGDTTPISRQAFAGSDTFTVAGAPIAQDAALIEAGLDVNLTKAATLGVAYQGQFGGGAMQNGFKADFSVKF